MQTPPLQGVFYEGQLWDACSLVEKLIGRAKKTILLIDSWVEPGTLDMLAKKRKGVTVEIVASPRGNKLTASDITKFNAQYGGLSVKTSMTFHDQVNYKDSLNLQELFSECYGCRFSTVCRTQLCEYRREVLTDTVHPYAESLCDVLICQTTGDEG